MDFQRFYDDDLAQMSYAVACENSKRAIIVDPLRDFDQYVDWANEQGYEIALVFETHIHADFMSGARELAAATGAQLLLSQTGEYENLERLDVRRLNDGDHIKMGSVRMRVLATAGHTPEHLSLSVLDRSDSERFVFTGDFMFDSELGRPDLLDNAEEQAAHMFEALHRFLGAVNPDAVVWPGHGAGSSCGKSLGRIPATTVGREAREAWWAEMMRRDDEDGFVEKLLENPPEVPRYFPRMKRLNRTGMEIFGALRHPPRLTPARFRAVAHDGALVVDVRDPDQFAKKHVRGSLNVPLSSLSSYAGATLEYRRPIVLLCPASDVLTAMRKLVRVGFDDVGGFVPSVADAESTDSMDHLGADGVHDVWRDDEARILDVRSASEYGGGHIPGVTHVYFGEMPDRVEELDSGDRWVVHCSSGVRASLAASLMRAHGFEDVSVFPGGPDEWKAAGYQLEVE